MIRPCKVRELPGGGWEIDRARMATVRVATPADALELIRLDDRRHELLTGQVVTSSVSWSTTTGIGRVAVRDAEATNRKAEGFARALTGTTERYLSGMMARATWSTHMRATWRRIDAEGVKAEVMYWPDMSVEEDGGAR